MQVTDFLDKYVGESEGKLKKIFADYRTCCRMAKATPILLLNEGDAILSKRTTNVEKSVDQMANALQNILLEEMENLEGIMIVTTNMTMNLDKAFERRFIFKIQFDKPSREVKARIWQSMIEELDDSASQELAETYDISILSQAQSMKSEGTETFSPSNAPQNTPDNKPTATPTNEVKTDLKFTYGLQSDSASGTSWLQTLTDASLKGLASYLKSGNATGEMTVTKTDGSTETVTCKDGSCYLSSGDCITCKDCTP